MRTNQLTALLHALLLKPVVLIPAADKKSPLDDQKEKSRAAAVAKLKCHANKSLAVGPEGSGAICSNGTNCNVRANRIKQSERVLHSQCIKNLYTLYHTRMCVMDTRRGGAAPQGARAGAAWTVTAMATAAVAAVRLPPLERGNNKMRTFIAPPLCAIRGANGPLKYAARSHGAHLVRNVRMVNDYSQVISSRIQARTI